MYSTDPQSFYGAHQHAGATPVAAQQPSSPPPVAYYQGPQSGAPEQHRYSQAFVAPPQQVYSQQPADHSRSAPPQSYAPQNYAQPGYQAPPQDHYYSAPHLQYSQQSQQPTYTQEKPAQFVSQQPMAGPQMVVKRPGGSKNALNKPVDNASKRDWSFDLFSCCDDGGTSVMSLFACCCLYGQTRSKLKALEATDRPAPGGGDMCNGDCCVYGCLACCTGFQCVLVYFERQSLARRYNIRDDAAADFFVAWCCTCCAQVQHARELELEEQSIAV